MIDLNSRELRIGNFVKMNYGSIARVIQLDNCIKVAGNSTHFTNGVYGIPLTEDWLLKLGFIDNQIQTEAFIFTIYLYDCWHIVFKQKERFGNSESYITGFFEIHELQNIFAILTGQELQLTT